MVKSKSNHTYFKEENMKTEFNFRDEEYARISKFIGQEGVFALKHISELLKRQNWRLLADYSQHKLIISTPPRIRRSLSACSDEPFWSHHPGSHIHLHGYMRSTRLHRPCKRFQLTAITNPYKLLSTIISSPPLLGGMFSLPKSNHP